MKRRYLFILPLMALFLLPACFNTGSTAREEVLLPAMLMAWDGIAINATDGGANPVTVTEFGEQLKTGNVVAIRATWGILKTHAENSIQSKVDQGLISAGVAGSLRERLRMFDEAMHTMVFNHDGLIITGTSQ